MKLCTAREMADSWDVTIQLVRRYCKDGKVPNAVLTEQKELEELDAKVARTYLSRENYIRAVLAGYEIMEAPNVDARELMIQIRKVGTNLNHLVFLAQCQHFIDVPELRKMANAIWECHRAMMKAYTPPSVRKKIWKEED